MNLLSWSAAPLPSTPKPQLASDNSPMDDWHVLLRAVRDRLQRSAAQPVSDLPELIRDCVSALDQSQVELEQQLWRRQRLEDQLADAQKAIAQLQEQLQGAQAGERLVRHLAMHDVLATQPDSSCLRERLSGLSHRGEASTQPPA